MQPSTETPYLREPGYAERYRDQRFSSGSGSATHQREVRALQQLLQQASIPPGPWLDLPSGAGRMSDHLPGTVWQSDRHLQMLQACPQQGPRVVASAQHMPFVDNAFAGVLCLRLLQHIPHAAERVQILTELARVSRGPVLFSFFHAMSLQHGRRKIRRMLGKRNSGRQAISWRQCCQEMSQAGLRPVAWQPLRRFVSEQWLVLAEAEAKG